MCTEPVGEVREAMIQGLPDAIIQRVRPPERLMYNGPRRASRRDYFAPVKARFTIQLLKYFLKSRCAKSGSFQPLNRHQTVDFDPDNIVLGWDLEPHEKKGIVPEAEYDIYWIYYIFQFVHLTCSVGCFSDLGWGLIRRRRSILRVAIVAGLLPEAPDDVFYSFHFFVIQRKNILWINC